MGRGGKIGHDLRPSEGALIERAVGVDRTGGLRFFEMVRTCVFGSAQCSRLAGGCHGGVRGAGEQEEVRRQSGMPPPNRNAAFPRW